MTKPDKWGEIADRLTAGCKVSYDPDKGYSFEVYRNDLAAALRDAEKAGMERAAKIAKVQWLYSQRELIGDADREMELCEEIETAIRAAKEAKE